MSGKLAVIAFGGNALVRDADHQSIPDQYTTVADTVPAIIDMIEAGWNVVVTHGNGPQVGYILRRSELALSEIAPVPLDYAVGDTQGAIGYMFTKAPGQRAGPSRPAPARRHGPHPDCRRPRRRSFCAADQASRWVLRRDGRPPLRA